MVLAVFLIVGLGGRRKSCQGSGMGIFSLPGSPEMVRDFFEMESTRNHRNSMKKEERR